MGVEIERKFLVKYDLWLQLEKPAGQPYRQGYILTDPAKTIRVRIAGAKAFLTIKGITVGATRAEYEYTIPVNEAQELLNNFAVAELSKTRYNIMHNDKLWEVDEFAGDNSGLIVAEIELQSEAEQFTVPDWVAKEITEEEKYYNSNLSLHPFKHWQ